MLCRGIAVQSGKAGSNGGEVTMDKGDSHGAFADGGSTAFDGAVTNVTGGKEPRHAGFEIVRSALKGPLGGKNAVRVEVGPGDKVAVRIATDTGGGGPFGPGLSAETEEEKACFESLLLAGLIVGEGDGAEHEITVKRGDLGVRQDFDFRASLDAVDEVLGERSFQAVATDDDSDFFGSAREMHGGLSSGITTAYDEDVLIDASVGFTGPGAIKEADVEEFFLVGKA